MRKNKKQRQNSRGKGSKTIANDDLFVVDNNNVWHFDNDYPYAESFKWITKSDVVYGTGGRPFRQGQDPYSIFKEEAPNSPWTQPEFYSYQWEYEFSKDTIIFTQGGDDGPIDDEPGRDVNRLVIKGSFNYTKDGITGEIDYWVAQNTPIKSFSTRAGISTFTLAFQPVIVSDPIDSLVFEGFGQIGDVISAAGQNDSTLITRFGVESDQPVQILPTGSKYDSELSLFPVNWWEDPYAPNLI
jgi:hypothetical protein